MVKHNQTIRLKIVGILFYISVFNHFVGLALIGLTVNITFKLIFNSPATFLNSPVFLFAFGSEQFELMPVGIHNYLEFCHQPLLLTK